MRYNIQKWGRLGDKLNPTQFEWGGMTTNLFNNNLQNNTQTTSNAVQAENPVQTTTQPSTGVTPSASGSNLQTSQGIAGAGNAIGSGLQSTGSSLGTIGGGALKGVATGAAIGSIIPGVGTVIGAGVGAVAGAVGGIFKNKQRKEEEKLQEEQEKQMLLAQKQQQLLSMPQSSGGIGYETRLNPTQMVHGGYLQIPVSAKSGMYIKSNKQYKYGGPVNYTQDSTKSLVAYMGGGTHQQNPLGGIPLGKTINGKQNTVEQGETSFKFKEGKYIFSNRLSL